jgi:hypothetical protein
MTDILHCYCEPTYSDGSSLYVTAISRKSVADTLSFCREGQSSWVKAKHVQRRRAPHEARTFADTYILSPLDAGTVYHLAIGDHQSDVKTLPD